MALDAFLFFWGTLIVNGGILCDECSIRILNCTYASYPSLIYVDNIFIDIQASWPLSLLVEYDTPQKNLCNVKFCA